jgi:calcineurin-like phosphoesterase family protein
MRSGCVDVIFFTADTHFGHGGALGLYRRPFASVAAMDEAMERLWNETVGPNDEVWHLGDVAVGPRSPGPALAFHERLAGRLSRLNGRKHLVTGNNDAEHVRSWPGWLSVQAYAEMSVDGVPLVLCHYAFRSWKDMRRAINLHGHSHGRLAPMPRQYDVGVDVHDFRPVTLETLTKRPAKEGLRRRNANPRSEM